MAYGHFTSILTSKSLGFPVMKTVRSDSPHHVNTDFRQPDMSFEIKRAKLNDVQRVISYISPLQNAGMCGCRNT